jgi:hypothetical protein
LFHTLATAQTYEEWEEAAFELDELLSKDLWYVLTNVIIGNRKKRLKEPMNRWLILSHTGVRILSVDTMTIDLSSAA